MCIVQARMSRIQHTELKIERNPTKMTINLVDQFVAV